VGGEHPSTGAGRQTAEDDAELAFDEDDLELEESEADDATAVSESRFREAADTAALGDIYQRVKQLVPLDQDLLTLDVGTSAVVGLRKLDQHGYSQAPVMHDHRCIGVFSYLRQTGIGSGELSIQIVNQKGLVPTGSITAPCAADLGSIASRCF
jgi:hypothetical protein